MSNDRSSAAASSGAPRRNRRPTLLCIDDDPDAVGAIVAALRPYEVKVLTDFNGDQGFWEAIRAKPDLIVTDLCMPQGSGEMLLECLRRNPDTRGIPVIVVTGVRRADLFGHVKHLGAARFLQKPYPVATLVREIRRFVWLRERRPAAARGALPANGRPTTGSQSNASGLPTYSPANGSESNGPQRLRDRARNP